MRLINLFPREKDNHFIQAGLKFQKMENLGQIVGVFGKNGSGKTRLLKYVSERFQTLKHQINHSVDQMRLYESMELKPSLQEKYNKLQAEHAELAKDILNFENQDIIELKATSTKIFEHANMNDSEYRNETIMLLANPNYPEVKSHCSN